MSTNTPKTVEEQLVEMRSELDNMKVFINRSMTGISSSVNEAKTAMSNDLSTEVDLLESAISEIESKLVAQQSAINNLRTDHDALTDSESRVNALIQEVNSVKEKTTSGLTKLKKEIGTTEGVIKAELATILDELGVNSDLHNQINGVLNATQTLRTEIFSEIYRIHPDKDVTVSVVAHTGNPSQPLTSYTVGTVASQITYYIDIVLSRDMVSGESIVDGTGAPVSGLSNPVSKTYRVSGFTINTDDSTTKQHTYGIKTKYDTVVKKTISINRAYRTYNFMYGGAESELRTAINGKSGAELGGVEGIIDDDVREVHNTTPHGTQTISARSSVTGGEKYLYYLVPVAMGNSGSLTMVQSGQNGPIGTKYTSTVTLNGIEYHIYKSNQKMGEHPKIELQ